MRPLVFSDLDGTLLDRETCSPAAAPAFAALRAAGDALILATGKTEARIAPLRRALGFPDAPAIVENGAGLAPPEAGAASPSAIPAREHRVRAASGTLPRPQTPDARASGRPRPSASGSGASATGRQMVSPNAAVSPAQAADQDLMREMFEAAKADSAEFGG